MGNPHAVQVVDVDTAPVGAHGPLIERHAFSAAGQRRLHADRRSPCHQAARLRARLGRNPACGTGACAAAVAGIRRGLLDSPVRVTTRGGDLNIAWGGAGGRS
jgi:diaminopimelate epimerase